MTFPVCFHTSKLGIWSSAHLLSMGVPSNPIYPNKAKPSGDGLSLINIAVHFTFWRVIFHSKCHLFCKLFVTSLHMWTEIHILYTMWIRSYISRPVSVNLDPFQPVSTRFDVLHLLQIPWVTQPITSTSLQNISYYVDSFNYVVGCNSNTWHQKE